MRAHENSAHPILIVGTDTDVGKTVVSAIFMLAYNTYYWKPIQCGRLGDSKRVRTLTKLPTDRFLPPRYSFLAPCSPNQAAEVVRTRIDVRRLLRLPVERPLVIEGIGGVCVPLNTRTTCLDLFATWRIPTVVVARGTVGTLNHTLLTLEALRARHIPIQGVVINGALVSKNRRDIEHFGQVPVLFHLPIFRMLNAMSLRTWARRHMGYATDDGRA